MSNGYDALDATIDTLRKRVNNLRRENKELSHLFEVQRKRMKTADRAWRKAHPKQKDVLPDLGDLLKWYSDRVLKLGAKLKDARQLIAEVYTQCPEENDWSKKAGLWLFKTDQFLKGKL